MKGKGKAAGELVDKQNCVRALIYHTSMHRPPGNESYRGGNAVFSRTTLSFGEGGMEDQRAHGMRIALPAKGAEKGVHVRVLMDPCLEWHNRQDRSTARFIEDVALSLMVQ